MKFYKNNELVKVAVIGAGQIGPDIALHFAKSLSSSGVKVINIDISDAALEKAKEKAFKKIQKGVDTGAFKPEQAERIKNALTFSSDYENVRGCQLVVEAATEDENIKDKIFKQVEAMTDDNCVYLSNSSHMQPEVIFRNMKNKTRCLVAHYFFPAEINPAVEIVPGKETSAELANYLLKFYEEIGKVPVLVKSSYGYAVDPVFEGICQTAIMCLERGWGNEKEIDKAAVKALGLGVGPFTALNLTGGNPITGHGLDEMGKLTMPWFKTPAILHEKVKDKSAWNTAQRGEVVELAADKEEKLVNEFRGAYFALTSFIFDIGIIDIHDYNMICEISLVMKAPFTYMNQLGIEKSYNLVKEFCKNHPTFPFPKVLEKAKSDGGWKIRDIVTQKENGSLVVTIRRPKVLNALNLEVLKQIREALEEVKNDASVKSAVITGFGTKAFVSGADLNMLASLKTPEEGYDNSRTFQSVLDYIESYPKPIVCAMNGFAFGGGNELAMACTTRICKKGLSVLVCQPEVNLGFIPGAGGTQRLPRIVGVEKASEILRTARNVSAKEAEEIGLVHAAVDGNIVAYAIQLANQIASGEVKVKTMVKEPISANGNPKPVELGHLSKKIDEILTRAIYEGSRLSLKDGLDLESRMFGECLKTQDMKIGLDNFKTNGPKVKANFIHE
ncbi:MAG: 3-hydroxyacyl-CoA dehydrogenase/enoyl-CoA hydratase family protein [Crocinitomicaceae bacterium]|nr:3-hydroxyacyl-CoA dehydrogenase/enoyl-CoA hydratase family protein [Crocinitomicaceae bacterium]MBK8925501.1 3-hydroxyacyl-CoA dehydrogenase/enoyl-CoA hydratase family protein [Crocinitomicaceae bacterium]